MSVVSEHGVEVRRELGPGDAEAIVDLQYRLYRAEYGVDDRFAQTVRATVREAVEAGWPSKHGAVWLVEHDGELRGSLALTLEGGDVGRVRWFLLGPELRGRGFGRALIAELLAEAEAAGMRQLVLHTFSALTTAAKIYRDVGFRVVSEHVTDRWGPEIVEQQYELDLH
jgi:GNAT superfamily N-acetyltransferase